MCSGVAGAGFAHGSSWRRRGLWASPSGVRLARVTLTTVHVEADAGPSEMTCRKCGNLALPVLGAAPEDPNWGDLRRTLGAAYSAARFIPCSWWTCFVCDRAFLITWGAKA